MLRTRRDLASRAAPRAVPRRIGWLALELGLLASLALIACADGEAQPSMEIAPVSACRGSACKDAGAREDESHDASSTSAPEEPASGADHAGAAPRAHDPSPATNTCQTAADMGELSGEPKVFGEIQSRKTAGRCTTWAKLRVLETSRDYEFLRLRAKLTSPPSKKFDLFAYVNPAKDEIECQTPIASSASALSGVDEVIVRWEDTWGSDDSRTLTFLVKSRDGSCAADADWSLVVENTGGLL